MTTTRNGFSTPTINDNDTSSLRRAFDEFTENLNRLLMDTSEGATITRIIKSGGSTGGPTIITPVTIRVTTSPYTIVSGVIIFVDTDAIPIVINLPPSSNGRNIKIINCGSSGNDVSVTPDGTDLLFGDNAVFTLIDSEIINLHKEATEGWW